MVSKEFVELSDKLIIGFQEKRILVGNGNVIIAKPTAEEKTKGGIVIADITRELDQKRMGFGRVIAIPQNLDPANGDIDIKPGDYIWFVFVSDSPIHYKSIGEIVGVTIPKETVFFTGDNEIIAKVSSDEVHAKSNL